MAAAASALEKDVEEIAGLIASLTRDLLPCWAVDVDVNVNDISIDPEQEGAGEIGSGRGVR